MNQNLFRVNHSVCINNVVCFFNPRLFPTPKNTHMVVSNKYLNTPYFFYPLCGGGFSINSRYLAYSVVGFFSYINSPFSMYVPHFFFRTLYIIIHTHVDIQKLNPQHQLAHAPVSSMNN